MIHPFQKSFYTARQHLELLRARGLQIDDESKVIDYITNIGYKLNKSTFIRDKAEKSQPKSGKDIEWQTAGLSPFVCLACFL